MKRRDAKFQEENKNVPVESKAKLIPFDQFFSATVAQ